MAGCASQSIRIMQNIFYFQGYETATTLSFFNIRWSETRTLKVVSDMHSIAERVTCKKLTLKTAFDQLKYVEAKNTNAP